MKKSAIFCAVIRETDKICTEKTIFTSNTSSISITKLASFTK
ncbi:MAG: 3-hydroxyacyl-CoA dehydrogenase NAD-binding domain-containing protein [Methanosarcinales archaeon]